MKKIYDFTKFVNENLFDIKDDDFSVILDAMLKVPTPEILEFRDELRSSINESKVNEAFTKDLFYKLKWKFRRWFTDKLFDYLINRKKEYYEKLVDKLNIFDLENYDDVFESFPAFKLRSLYLAGGMDAAKKGGKVGWRNMVEYIMEINHPGDKKNAPEIEIYLGKEGDEIVKVKPSYTIDGAMLDLFIKNPNKCLSLYNAPMLLNPVRKEVDRNKMDFDKYIRALKDGNSSQEDLNTAIRFFRETVSKRIAYEDELIINRCDAIFLGLNPVAGAGTYAELQFLSFIEKPLFCALVEGYENQVGGFKLWNMPQLCKLARNEKEIPILAEGLYKSAHR
jgi:regulator of sigma D